MLHVALYISFLLSSATPTPHPTSGQPQPPTCSCSLRAILGGTQAVRCSSGRRTSPNGGGGSSTRARNSARCASVRASRPYLRGCEQRHRRQQLHGATTHALGAAGREGCAVETHSMGAPGCRGSCWASRTPGWNVSPTRQLNDSSPAFRQPNRPSWSNDPYNSSQAARLQTHPNSTALHCVPFPFDAPMVC